MKNRVFWLTGVFYVFVQLLILSLIVQTSFAGEPILSKGQTVYVPVYSHIIVGGGKREIPFELSINLSIRNTDSRNPITIVSADYYDSDGVLVKGFISEPLRIKPMASTYFLIRQSDSGGGWGANYLIRWKSETEVNEPIIEGVTYGSRGTHSISFINRGKVIKE